eukprot:g11265.t1
MPRRRRRLGSSSCQHAAGAAARRIRSPAQLFLFLERSPTPAADAQFLARRESSEDLEVSSAGDVFLQEGVEALNKKASEREGGRAAEADLSITGSRDEPIARHGVGGSLASGREDQDGADEASGFLQRRQHESSSLTPSPFLWLKRAAGALFPGNGWWHMPFMNRIPSLRSWFRTAEQSVTAATDVGKRSQERAAGWRDGASGWRDSVRKQVAQFAGMSRQQMWHALERRLPAWTMRLLGQEPALLENVLTSDLVRELEAKCDPKNQERDHAGHHEGEQNKLFFQAPQFENFLEMMKEFVFGFGEGVPLEPLVEKADVDRIFLADEQFEENLVRAYKNWEEDFLAKHFPTEDKVDEHKLKKAPDSVDSGAKAMDEVRRKIEAYNVLRTLSWLYKKLVWQLPKKSHPEHLDEPDEVAKVVMKMKSGRSEDRKNVLTKLSDIVLANYDPRSRRSQPSRSHRQKITESLEMTKAEENARGPREPRSDGKSEAEEQLEFFESSRPVPTYHLGTTIEDAAQKQLFTEEQFDGRVVDIPAMLASILTFVEEAEVKAAKPAGVGTLIGKPVMGVIQGMAALAKKIAGTGFTGAGNHGRDRVVEYKRRWTTGELPMRLEPPGADSYTYKGEYYTNLVVEGGQEPRDISINEIREPIMNGKGTMTYGNGDFYVGDWEDGKKHGFGNMTWAKPHNGQKWVRGMWHKEMSDKPPTSGTEHRVNAAGHVYEGKFEIKYGKRVQ